MSQALSPVPGPAESGPASKAAAPFAPGRVLLYGWSEEVTLALTAALGESGLHAAAVDEAGVLGAGVDDVVLSSTLALESLLGPRERLRSRVIVCGTPEHADMEAAETLGARVYLPPPFSVVQLAAAVQRCHEAAARRHRQRSV